MNALFAKTNQRTSPYSPLICSLSLKLLLDEDNLSEANNKQKNKKKTLMTT